MQHRQPHDLLTISLPQGGFALPEDILQSFEVAEGVALGGILPGMLQELAIVVHPEGIAVVTGHAADVDSDHDTAERFSVRAVDGADQAQIHEASGVLSAGNRVEADFTDQNTSSFCFQSGCQEVLRRAGGASDRGLPLLGVYVAIEPEALEVVLIVKDDLNDIELILQDLIDPMGVLGAGQIHGIG